MGLSARPKQAIMEALRFAFPYSLFPVARYIRRQKRIPNIIFPSAFTEKVLCKMLFDRNEQLPIIADKLAVRDYVRARVGFEVLTKIYAIYESEAQTRLDTLPDRFVLKANHGSHFNYFVKSAADKRADIIAPVAREWLSTNYGRSLGEWAYTSIQPRLFAEEYLETEADRFVDYKFFCFDGEPRYVKASIIDPADHCGNYFDLDWQGFEAAETRPRFPASKLPRPPNSEEMIEVARQLSAGFDSLRVDLYDLGKRVVFGELTNYHNAGVRRIEPVEYDYKFGSHWKPESMTYLPINWRRSAK